MYISETTAGSVTSNEHHSNPAGILYGVCLTSVTSVLCSTGPLSPSNVSFKPKTGCQAVDICDCWCKRRTLSIVFNCSSRCRIGSIKIARGVWFRVLRESRLHFWSTMVQVQNNVFSSLQQLLRFWDKTPLPNGCKRLRLQKMKNQQVITDVP